MHDVNVYCDGCGGRILDEVRYLAHIFAVERDESPLANNVGHVDLCGDCYRTMPVSLYEAQHRPRGHRTTDGVKAPLFYGEPLHEHYRYTERKRTDGS